MAIDYYYMPAALACASASVDARYISKPMAQRHTDVGLCLRYKCERDTTVCITKERIPKECEFNQEAHMNLGDQLVGKSVVVYEAGVRPARKSKTSNYSATHSNGALATNNKTYAELTEPFENLVNSAANHQMALFAKQQSTLSAAPEESSRQRKGKPRHQKPIEDIEADLSDSE